MKLKNLTEEKKENYLPLKEVNSLTSALNMTIALRTNLEQWLRNRDFLNPRNRHHRIDIATSLSV